MNDASGKRELCGYKNVTENYDNEGYEYLVITDWSGGSLGVDVMAMFDSGVCVERCPTSDDLSISCKPDVECPEAENVGLSSGSYDLLGLCLPTEVP
jgi:hypothetical protein